MKSDEQVKKIQQETKERQKRLRELPALPSNRLSDHYYEQAYPKGSLSAAMTAYERKMK
jgi:hypothetical protein